MKIKDIMDLSSEEKVKITRKFSVNDSSLFKRERALNEARLQNLSKPLIDIEPYSLNYGRKNNESTISERHYHSQKNDTNDLIINENKSKDESISEEEQQKIREIVNSINFFNKTKNKKKLNKCQSVFSDNPRIRRYGDYRLAKSYSHMSTDVKRDEFMKSLRDFNIKMKNYTKMANMKNLKLQQKKLFIERLKDLYHYLKYLDRYCKELNEFSKKENENIEIIKEMENFSRNKYKLLRKYIKGNLINIIIIVFYKKYIILYKTFFFYIKKKIKNELKL